MYSFDRSEKLVKELRKLFKKDRLRYDAVMKKVEEVMSCSDPHHYKNLCYDMKEYKRVHIDSHFVLIFKVDDRAKLIRFEDIQHHDIIYR